MAERVIIHAAVEHLQLAAEWVKQAMTEGATSCGFRRGNLCGFARWNKSGSWTIRVYLGDSDDRGA